MKHLTFHGRKLNFILFPSSIGWDLVKYNFFSLTAEPTSAENEEKIYEACLIKSFHFLQNAVNFAEKLDEEHNVWPKEESK